MKNSVLPARHRSFLRFACLSLCFSLLAVGGMAQAWSAVGSGLDGNTKVMIEYNGELYVGGAYRSPASVPFVGLLKWNGTAFDTLPGTYRLGAFTVDDMAVFNNELYVTGTLCKNCWPVPGEFNVMVRWNGITFDSVSNGFLSPVRALEMYQGELYAAGYMRTVNGIVANGIIKWDGSQWSGVGNGIDLNAAATRLEVYGNELYVAGGITFQPDSSEGIVRWDGVSWRGVGEGGVNGMIYSMTKYNGELYVAGPYFDVAGGVPVNGIAKWNGVNWMPVGTGIRRNIDNYGAFQAYQGELYVGGDFMVINGDSMRNITRFDGNNWNSVGYGVDSAFIDLDTIFSLGDTILTSTNRVSSAYEFNGELYVAGSFDMIGGITARNIAKWNAPVGVREPNASDPILLFPNPATEAITIQGLASEKKYFVQIYNVHGQIVYANAGYRGGSIDVSDFESGIYLLKCSIGKTAYRKRFVVSH